MHFGCKTIQLVSANLFTIHVFFIVWCHGDCESHSCLTVPTHCTHKVMFSNRETTYGDFSTSNWFILPPLFHLCKFLITQVLINCFSLTLLQKLRTSYSNSLSFTQWLYFKAHSNISFKNPGCRLLYSR